MYNTVYLFKGGAIIFFLFSGCVNQKMLGTIVLLYLKKMVFLVNYYLILILGEYYLILL